jgi:hypothetical protein
MDIGQDYSLELEVALNKSPHSTEKQYAVQKPILGVPNTNSINWVEKIPLTIHITGKENNNPNPKTIATARTNTPIILAKFSIYILRQPLKIG